MFSTAGFFQIRFSKEVQFVLIIYCFWPGSVRVGSVRIARALRKILVLLLLLLAIAISGSRWICCDFAIWSLGDDLRGEIFPPRHALVAHA